MLEGAAAINVGNPHLVVFVPDLDDVPLERLGPQIETDPLFPNRINVNVAQIIDKGRVRARTWERGAGLTQACGTGACDTAVEALRAGLAANAETTERPVGPLDIDRRPGRTRRNHWPHTPHHP